MVDSKKLLTDEQIWRDLLEIRYFQQGAGIGLVFSIILLGSAVVFSIVLTVLSFVKNALILLPVTIPILIAGLCLIPYLWQKQKRRKNMALAVPMDPDAMIFDFDTCIQKKIGFNDDPDLLVFSNPYKEVCGDGFKYPFFAFTEVNDRFCVVSLKGYPKVFRYYSMKMWQLESHRQVTAEKI